MSDPLHDHTPSRIAVLAVLLVLLPGVIMLRARSEVPAPQDANSSGSSRIRALLQGQRYSAAEASARELLTKAENANGKDSAEAGTALNLLVEVLLAKRQAGDEPQRLATRAVALHEAGGGSHGLELACSLQNLAVVRGRQGRYTDARQLAERAFAIYDRLGPPDSPLLASSISLLAIMRGTVGDYTGARQLHERLLTMRQRTLGPEHLETAAALNNFGVMLWETGDYAAAATMLERAMATYERALGKDHVDLASVAANVGLLLGNTGRLPEALRLHLRSLAIFEKAHGPDHPAVGQALTNLGFVQKSLGDLAASTRSYQRALGIYENALGPNHPALATALQNVGTNLANAGQLRDARESLERAVGIWESTLGPEHPVLAPALYSLSAVLTNMRNWAAAAPVALKAENVRRAHIRLTIRTLSEREALAYASRSPTALNLAIALAEQQPSVSRRPVWDAVIRSRTLVLDELAVRHRRAVTSDREETAHFVRQLSSARDRLARLSVRGSEQTSGADDLQDVAQAQREREAAERLLAANSPEDAAAAAREQIGVHQVLAALPPDAALVAFIRYRRADLKVEASSTRAAPLVTSYAAFVARSGDAEPVVVPIGAADEIDPLIADWRDAIVEQSASTGVGDRRLETAYRQRAGALRRKIWDPLRPHIGNATRVTVVLDGALHLVNLAALPDTTGGYLLETGPQIAYVTAERDLVPSTGAKLGSGMLAVGGPSFDAKPDTAPATSVQTRSQIFRGESSTCADFTSMRFDALPSARREAEDVAALWGSHRKPADVAEKVVLTGAAASEAAFKRSVSGRRVVHLATHAFFMGSTCPSVLEGAQRAASARRMNAENPLLLAGLVMAAANNRGAAPAGQEDGILTAEEIAALDLTGVEWAVLSGCDTGIGRLRAGEGAFGLRRAFQVAGARTVIMSLWPVDDVTTREWMMTLYRRRYRDGRATPEAVRDASRAVLESRRRSGSSTHPFYWAGFVAVGDPR